MNTNMNIKANQIWYTETPTHDIIKYRVLGVACLMDTTEKYVIYEELDPPSIHRVDWQACRIEVFLESFKLFDKEYSAEDNFKILEFLVLMSLWKQQAYTRVTSITIKEINSDIPSYSRSAIAKVIPRLKYRGFVEEGFGGGLGDAKSYYLTPTGEAVIKYYKRELGDMGC